MDYSSKRFLTSTNYFQWKSHVEDLLRSKGLYLITLGKEKETVSIRSHSWIAIGVEPNTHQFMSRINLMGDQMGRDPRRYHSNSGTKPGM
jgi:hypothetical protein